MRPLDAVLAPERARIAAAHKRNLAYVEEKESNAKARAKAAAAAAAAVAQAQAEGKEVEPAAKLGATGRGKGVNPSACSIYVSGLPADTNALEVQEHFQIVSPVTRVKLYKDARGGLKGDCLVTFDKEAAVIGACQLLNNKMLRPGMPLSVSRAVFGEGAEEQPPPPPLLPPTSPILPRSSRRTRRCVWWWCPTSSTLQTCRTTRKRG